MTSWNNNIMASCTKQERRKKDQKLSQGSCSLIIDDVQKKLMWIIF